MNIEETISQVERLYQQATGQQLPNGQAHHPIHPNMDPIALLEARFTELLTMIQDPRVQKQLQPWTPPLSVWESDEKIFIRVDLPGVGKEEIDISLKNNMVYINGLRRNLPQDAGFMPRMVETQFGHFARTVVLPAEIVNTEISSSVKDGVLEITLQKQGANRPKKNTNVKSVQ